MRKSGDFFAGMNAALREVRSVCDFNDQTAASATNEAERERFEERARGAAECEQYIRTVIETLGGEPERE